MYFMISQSFWDLVGDLSCPFWSIAQQCGAQLPIHTLNYWTELFECWFLGWRCFTVQPSASTIWCSVVHAIFKIKSNPMHPLSGALPLSYCAGVDLTPGALVAHRHSFPPNRCRTSQYRITFVPIPSDPVFDGVGLEDFNGMCFPVGIMCSVFLSPTIFHFSSFHGLVLWGWGLWIYRVYLLSRPALHCWLIFNNDNNNNMCFSVSSGICWTRGQVEDPTVEDSFQKCKE